MNFDPATFKEIFAATRLINVVQAAIIIFGGMLLVRLASRSLDALLRRTLEPQQAAMGGKISSYVMTGIVAPACRGINPLF